MFFKCLFLFSLFFDCFVGVFYLRNSRRTSCTGRAAKPSGDHGVSSMRACVFYRPPGRVRINTRAEK